MYTWKDLHKFMQNNMHVIRQKVIIETMQAKSKPTYARQGQLDNKIFI